MKYHFFFPSPNFILLFSAMLFFGMVGLYSGKDVHFDLLSYHFYSPYSYWHHRWEIDDWSPNSTQVYLNPTLDFLTYFLIHFFKPSFAVFAVGSIHGINFWLLFKISRFFLSNIEKKYAVLFSFVLATLGMYCPVVFAQIGAFLGDNIISLFVLSSVLVYLNRLSSYAWISGFLMGTAVGLKLTATCFALGFLFSMMIIERNQKKIIICWLVACLLGFLMFAGHWMLFLWQHFHNPFYPYFNKIFKAPGFPYINFRDEPFFPTDGLHWIFFPFFYLWQGRSIDKYYLDFRFVMAYVLMIWWVVVAIKKRKTINLHSHDIWFILFFLFSYIIWEMTFSILRYLIPLHLLAPIFIYLLMNSIFQESKLKIYYFLLVFSFLFVTTMPMINEKIPAFGQNYFGVELPLSVQKENNAMVLLLGPTFSNRYDKDNIKLLNVVSTYPLSRLCANSYLIPYFPSNWQFIIFSIIDNRLAITKRAYDMINHFRGSYYLIAPRIRLAELYQGVAQLGLIKAGECEKIKSEASQFVLGNDILLCSLKKN